MTHNKTLSGSLSSQTHTMSNASSKEESWTDSTLCAQHSGLTHYLGSGISSFKTQRLHGREFSYPQSAAATCTRDRNTRGYSSTQDWLTLASPGEILSALFRRLSSRRLDRRTAMTRHMTFELVRLGFPFSARVSAADFDAVRKKCDNGWHH